MIFSQEEYQRYARHIKLPQLGEQGQAKLKSASVLCIGAGGLGSPILMYLAAAGVGTIGIVDADKVERSNLHRQIIHDSENLQKNKAQSAKERLEHINPHVKVVCYEKWFDKDNASDLVSQYDIVVDGSDNFTTRYLSNDACYFHKKPNIYGSIFQFEGQCSVFAPHLGGPCFRCIFPQPPDPNQVPSCEEAGVLGILPGIIGNFQALEVIKLITDVGNPLIGRFVYFDASAFSMRTLKIKSNPACPLCGDSPSITSLDNEEIYCESQVNQSDEIEQINVQQLQRLIQNGNTNIIDVRQAHELEICHMNQAKHIPLDELSDRLSELSKDESYILLCHHGSRSQYACQILQQAGFKNLKNVSGGIHDWAIHIEPSMRRY